MIIPVVLAGGSGSRLWPLSRQLHPKQFISFNSADSADQQTLFQQSLSRLQGIEGLGAPIVVCNEEHRFLVAEQLRQLDIIGATILLEPFGRNTAPAVAMAALLAAPDDCLLVLPADHVIRDVQELQRVISLGAQLAEAGHLVTFGIVANSPETGYGYIQCGEALDNQGFQVKRFVEKPALEIAKAYLASGDYYWNSGMFMFKAAGFLNELSKHAAHMLQVCRISSAGLQTDNDFTRIPADIFSTCPSDSIDYAVMEKTSQAAVIPLDANWNDLGAWNSLWEVAEKDADNNVLLGDVSCIDVHNSYIRSGSRLIAAIGLQDMIVVDTADAVLIASKDQVQSVKQIVQKLEMTNRAESLGHTLVYRPWGSYESLVLGDGFQVKHIRVKPGASLSLQMHHHRAEHWVVIQGTATVTCDDNVFDLQANESTFIPLGSKHRLQNRCADWVDLIEVQTGGYLGEDDIVRFDDVYGRAP